MLEEEGGYPIRIQECIHNPSSIQTKGNPKASDNHRGISHLSIAVKILEKIYRIARMCLDQAGLIPESQCGFRKDRGTIDMIFTARQLHEKCQE